MKPVRTPSTTSTKISNRSNSTSISSQKKKNRSNFQAYYADLCQIQSIPPLTIIKQHLDNGVLDFVGDRIKFEEWWTIINALSCDKTLHFVGIRSRHPTKFALENMDTELKVRGVCKQPVIKTRFVLMWLMESLKLCLAQSTALTVLELEGLPIGGEYLLSLCRGIMQSTSIQHISFHKSHIQDQGAEIICSTIKNLPSVITLDLSCCGITSSGAEAIAGLIKYQKLNRYSETWKQTLRYRDPDVEAMPGLRRITINGNHEVGDSGISYLIEEIKDDLWLRALDVQDCGLSDEGGKMLANLVESNINLVVVDVRGNPFMSEASLSVIMNTLANNNIHKNQSEYKWISKNTNSNKKSYMVNSFRPWTCHSSACSTTKTQTTSECSLPFSQTSQALMRRSQTTLSQKDTLSWRINNRNLKQAEKKNSIDTKIQIRLDEYESMKKQLTDLTTFMNEEVHQRLKLIEENNELKMKLEKCQNEKKKLEEVNSNKLTIQNDTLQILENIIGRFGNYLNQEMDEISEYSEVTQDENEIPEIMSSLKLLLQKASQDNDHEKITVNENKFMKKQAIKKIPLETDLSKPEIQYKNELQKKKNVWLRNKRDNTIWEEEEEEENISHGEGVTKNTNIKNMTKAQAVFAKLLGDSEATMKQNNRNVDRMKAKVEDSEMAYSSEDSDYNVKFIDIAERPLTSSDDFDSSS